MHYKRENLIMKSRDFVRRYLLLHDDATGWTDYVNRHYVAVKQTIILF